jgi:hypothetical protein
MQVNSVNELCFDLVGVAKVKKSATDVKQRRELLDRCTGCHPFPFPSSFSSSKTMIATGCKLCSRALKLDVAQGGRGGGGW